MKYIRTLLVMILLTLVFITCRKKETYEPLPEPVKDIKGKWEITAATRNGTDLMTVFDFSAFRLLFTDSTYTIENQVPFIVNKTGTYRFDDPVYPFKISFTQKDSAVKQTNLLFPITIKGKRNIVISFSPGCKSNIYQYTLQKVQ